MVTIEVQADYLLPVVVRLLQGHFRTSEVGPELVCEVDYRDDVSPHGEVLDQLLPEAQDEGGVLRDRHPCDLVDQVARDHGGVVPPVELLRTVSPPVEYEGF